MTAEQKGDICYWAARLSSLCTIDKGQHLPRLLDGKGFPTDEEIHQAKEQLDRAYQAAG